MDRFIGPVWSTRVSFLHSYVCKLVELESLSKGKVYVVPLSLDVKSAMKKESVREQDNLRQTEPILIEHIFWICIHKC